MSITSNDFQMSTAQGAMDLGVTNYVLSCQIASAETATLVAGQTVKLEDSAGGVPKLLARTADTDPVFGCIVRSTIKSEYVANDKVEVAIYGSVMYMTASAAVARGATVEAIVATKKVKTALGVNPCLGIALDKASGDLELIRILVISPVPVVAAMAVAGALSVGTTLGVTGVTTLADVLNVAKGIVGANSAHGVFSKRVRLTTAEMNAGADVVAAITGKKLRLIDCKIIAIGGNAAATANATAVAISGTQSASAVSLFRVNLAQLKRSEVNRIGSASTVVLTDGAFLVANDASTALTVAPVGGSDLIVATAYDVEVTFAVEA